MLERDLEIDDSQDFAYTEEVKLLCMPCHKDLLMNIKVELIF